MKPIAAISIIAILAVAGWGWMTLRNKPGKPAAAVPIGRIYLPADASPSCPLADTTFGNWFANGKPSLNGSVLPANSAAFNPVNNCAFYQWSEQMFLWATSPARQYGGNGTIFSSPAFYDVSPANAANQRFLIPHVPNFLPDMTAQLAKNGAHRLPVFRSKGGGIFEVIRHKAPPGKGTMLVDGSGRGVEVGDIRRDNNGAVRLFDKTGKAIDRPKPSFKFAFSNEKVLQEVVANGQRVFLDFNGNAVDVESSQATGDALMAQNGAIVYYLTMVNDMYAQFLMANDSHYMNSATFPTTFASRDSITAFARSQGINRLIDSNALAIEIKSSWVEAAKLPNPGDYIRIMATIPVYKKLNDSVWLAQGKRTAMMALVGMHIVGGVTRHPEMVWATFEHQNNAPNAAFQYINTGGKTITVNAQGGQNWVFSNTSSGNAYNNSHMGGVNKAGTDHYFDTLKAKTGYTISASNTNRAAPWGSVMDSVTNQQDLSSAASNTEVIYFNSQIQKLMPAGDVRKNYFFMGATWTFGGTPPNGNIYSAYDTTHGVAIGTSAVGNSTMETYAQSSAAAGLTTCFSCHNNNNSNAPSALSHVYAELQPLQAALRKRR